MSDIKTGLMFSPLTERVYWGRVNTKTGVSVGNSQKDITSDFIGVVIQKFPLNTRQNISCNGKVESVFIHVTEDKANKYAVANEMYEMLASLLNEHPVTLAHNKDIEKLLTKARGEL